MQKNQSMFYFITIIFSKIEIKRKSSVNFLSIIINENLTSKNHIKVIENKFTKLLGFLTRVVIYLIAKTYFSFVLIDINYANIASASTFKTKLQGILKKNKLAARIIFHGNWFDY